MLLLKTQKKLAEEATEENTEESPEEIVEEAQEETTEAVAEEVEIGYSDSVLDRIVKENSIEDVEAFVEFAKDYDKDENNYLKAGELEKEAAIGQQRLQNLKHLLKKKLLNQRLHQLGETMLTLAKLSLIDEIPRQW